MKRLVLILCVFFVVPLSSASADWRWAAPKLKARHVTYSCSDVKCLRKTYHHERHILKLRIKIYNKHRAAEWKYWVSQPIADCTWGGESSPPGDFSGKFARYRYTVHNGQGSDAYGKYQMMPETYANYAKYGDWSALDQEIAGHKLYADEGSSPWESCG